MGKDAAQTCVSSFLSHFVGRSLSSQLDASAIMSNLLIDSLLTPIDWRWQSFINKWLSALSEKPRPCKMPSD